MTISSAACAAPVAEIITVIQRNSRTEIFMRGPNPKLNLGRCKEPTEQMMGRVIDLGIRPQAEAIIAFLLTFACHCRRVLPASRTFSFGRASVLASPSLISEARQERRSSGKRKKFMAYTHV